MTTADELAPVTETLPEASTREAVEPGDHERFAHYVDKDTILQSAVTGSPVVALCGKVWVPSRDPARFPVCPECQRLFELGPEGRRQEWAERAGSEGPG